MTRILIPDDAARNWRYIVMGLGNLRIPRMTATRFVIFCLTVPVVGSLLLLLAQPMVAVVGVAGDLLIFLVGAGTAFVAAMATAKYLEPLIVGDRPARYWLFRVLPDVLASYVNALRRARPVTYVVTVRPGVFSGRAK